jgi:hypothetical protein
MDWYINIEKLIKYIKLLEIDKFKKHNINFYIILIMH